MKMQKACARLCTRTLRYELHMYILAPKMICVTNVAKLPAGLCKSLASAQPVYHASCTCHQLVADVVPRLCELTVQFHCPLCQGQIIIARVLSIQASVSERHILHHQCTCLGASWQLTTHQESAAAPV